MRSEIELILGLNKNRESKRIKMLRTLITEIKTSNYKILFVLMDGIIFSSPSKSVADNPKLQGGFGGAPLERTKKLAAKP